MLSKWICCWLFVLTVTNQASSDDPAVPRPPVSHSAIPTKAKQQRVSPKLLREAMALPEYRAQAIPAPSPLSTVPLQQLLEKLKANGDLENSALLEQLLREHQRLSHQSAHRPMAENLFNLRCEAIEVDLKQIPHDSVLRGNNLTNSDSGISTSGISTSGISTSGISTGVDPHSAAKIHHALEQTLKSRQGTRLFEPVTLTAIAAETVHFHQGTRLALPSSDGSSSQGFQEFGTIIDAKVTPTENDFYRVEFAIEIRNDHLGSPSSVIEPQVSQPNPLKPTYQQQHTSVLAKSGDVAIVVLPWGNTEQKVFLVTTVTPRKSGN